MARIIPAIMPRAFEDIAALAAKVPSAKEFQVDMVDGEFDDDMTWPYEAKGRLGDVRRFPEGWAYEVHLMVADPGYVGTLLANRGVQRIIAHVERMNNPAVCNEWRKAGVAEIGLACLLDTPEDALVPFLPHVDVVQVMGIAEIGAQGHRFDTRAIQRVGSLRAAYPDMPIAVDGGVSLQNIVALQDAGATRFVVGSAIFAAAHPEEAFVALQAAVDNKE